MKGARGYASLFKTGQYGRLYLESGEHARGKTFRIFVLPEGFQMPARAMNPGQLVNAVEVYGITGGQPGWTETYGWLHEGRWQQDFEKLVEARKAEVATAERTKEEAQQRRESEEMARIQALLATY